MRTAVVACALCACTSDPLDPPTGERVDYVVAGLKYPTSNTQARDLGLDLNDDGSLDNQLGMVMSTMLSHGIDFAIDAQQMLDRGELLPLVELQYARPSDPDDSIALTLRQGSMPSPPACANELDAVCRQHLQGDGQFVALPTFNQPLLAERAPWPVVLGQQPVTIAIPFSGEVIELELLGARVRVARADDAMLVGSLGGGLRKIDIETKLVPAFHRHLERIIAAECTPQMQPATFCGCPVAEYGGRYWFGTFDTNPKDCVITDEEIINNSLYVSLTSPDVTLDGELVLSVGIGFEAVPASF